MRVWFVEFKDFKGIMVCTVRKAEKSEVDWVNQRYDEVGFIHSTFDRELIAIAMVENQKAGIGKLVRMDENVFELGGMYVFESFRGKGVARRLVEFLLAYLPSQSKVYCIPFQHLLTFYEGYGFHPCTECDGVPEEILKKISWCKKTYNDPTSLLVLRKEKGRE